MEEPTRIGLPISSFLYTNSYDTPPPNVGGRVRIQYYYFYFMYTEYRICKPAHSTIHRGVT